jgi:transketolase
MTGRDETEALATGIRRLVLEQSKRAHVGHIGSCLSVADILAVLADEVLRGRQPDDPGRDRFVLSKGHAALALYAALHLIGQLSRERLETFCTDGASLGTHPEHVVPGIDFSTGSLGQGLSIGCGSALAARLARDRRRTFVLASDAECNEGSLWEAVMFAAHHRLGNLVAIVDVNGQQALGYTDDVLSLSPLDARWRAFGWDVHEVDGHDVGALAAELSRLDPDGGKPHVILARTTFGKGVSYMEQKIEWHYWPMSDEQYSIAISELEEGMVA